MQSLAHMPPHLPLAQAWFRATAVGSAASGEPQLGPDGSMDLAAVAATEFSCQVCPALHIHSHKCLSLKDAIFMNNWNPDMPKLLTSLCLRKLLSWQLPFC